MLRTFMPSPPIQPPDFTGKRVLVTGGSGFIGTNLLLRLASAPAIVLNLDLKPPPVAALRARRCCCDITDEAATRRAIVAFAPHYVLHLAGRTDNLGKTLADYAANTAGSRNVVEACRASGSIERFILTSSQFVCGPGALPASDVDFRPHTIYGESKVVAERELRALDPGFVWSIIRPTNVWGAFHPRYPQEFWRVLRRGLYLHPAGRPVIRSTPTSAMSSNRRSRSSGRRPIRCIAASSMSAIRPRSYSNGSMASPWRSPGGACARYRSRCCK
jgi:nucleoside-diphosphate-sugar epimerase